MMGVFAEYERSIFRERVMAGLARAKDKGTKSGKAIGRPTIPERQRLAIRAAYEQGEGGYRTISSGLASPS
jgi:DNA invertase Pin-like site-specific DNA recombinase